MKIFFHALILCYHEFCEIVHLKFRVITYGFARFGGNSDNGLHCGSFALNVNNVVSLSNWNYGVSLTY